MFPLLRESPSLSMGQRDQATDGWMRTIAQPRDTASVFFIALRVDHRRRPGRSMISKPLGETMRPRRYLERNRIASEPISLQAARACPSEADGRLCRNARLPDMCERPRANAKAALGMARAPSFFTMSNSPPRGLTRSPSRSRGAFSAPGLVSIHSRPTRRAVGGAPTGALFRLSRLRDATGPRE